MALGVACSIQADLGTSPVSSLPYVLSRITPLSVGTTTILVNSGLVLLQILILRRRYDPLQLLQLPVAWPSAISPTWPCGRWTSSSPPPTGSSGCSAWRASSWWGWGSA